MGIDREAFRGAIAELPGGLSDRQQRVAAAVAMRHQGYTLREAAAATDIPMTTIYRAQRGIGHVMSQGRTEADRTAWDAIHEASQAIALRASERVMEAMESEDLDPKDAVRAYAAATDRVVAFNSHIRPGAESDGGVSSLAKILAGHDVTIHARRPDADAVDVSPETDPS